jgi:hypothetical protein
MKSNPILEEVWRIKEELAREAGYDIHTFCEQLREWAKAHPHNGPIVRNADELRRLVDEGKRKSNEASAPALNEQPPKYGRE